MRRGGKMKTPYGLQVIKSCLSSTLHRDKLFCDLPGSALQGLDAISASATYPKGAVLFVEGQDAHGIFVICRGRVKLTASATGGKTLILRIAESGAVVGLPGTISGKPYELTAPTLEPVRANFVARDDFLKFLRTHGEVAVRVAEILSDLYFATCRGVRYLGLSGSASAKLARFVLDTAGEQRKVSSSGEQLRAKLALTHEEIAEIIGASRETVTRMFADFKRKKLLKIAGSTLVITDEPGLEKVSGA